MKNYFLSSKFSKWPKVLFGLVVVIVLALILGIFANIKTLQTKNVSTAAQQRIFAQQSSPTPTRSLVFLPLVSQSKQIDLLGEWKIYSDAAYGYSIQYPADWAVENMSSEDTLAIVVFRPKVSPSSFSNPDDKHVQQMHSIAAITVETDTVADVVRQIESYGLANSQKQEIIVNNVSGFRLEGETIAWDDSKQKSTTERSIVIVLPLGSNTWVFSFKPESPMYPMGDSIYGANHSEILNKMLASFTTE